MSVTAFAPAHLTGFFKIYPNTSAGAGITLQHGMLTTINAADAAGNAGDNFVHSIHINGLPSDAPVSNFVLRKYRKYLGCPLQIRHKTAIPIGCGLGMSAAGALSLSLSLNEWCGFPFPHSKCVKMAHDADVACGTGLASVDVQALGGLVSRKGGRGKPDVRRFTPPQLCTPIKLAIFGPISTASIITSKAWIKCVNVAGDAALSSFYAHPSLSIFSQASNSFAISSGLGKWAGGMLSHYPQRGMACLGKTIFEIGISSRGFDYPKSMKHPKIIITYPTNRCARVV